MLSVLLGAENCVIDPIKRPEIHDPEAIFEPNEIVRLQRLLLVFIRFVDENGRCSGLRIHDVRLENRREAIDRIRDHIVQVQV